MKRIFWMIIPAAVLMLAGPALADSTNLYAGLWVGSVSVEAVSEPRAADPNQPEPVLTPFELRLLIHVDNGGAVSLLNEVTVMEEPGVTVTNESGEETGLPARLVLVTDPALLSNFKGVGDRDGVPIGRRMTSVSFEFPNRHHLPLSGQFSPTGMLAGTISLPADHATNPFKHNYHPDHDNLNATFTEAAAEAYDVNRSITIAFSPQNPSAEAKPDYGYSSIHGVYRETISGLHRAPIHVQGDVWLNRLYRVGTLNQ